MSNMKIGIASPISTVPLAEFLEEDITNAPKGLGGTTVVELVKGLLHKGHRVSVYSLDLQVATPIVLKGKLLTIYYGPYRPKHRMRDFMKVERHSIRDFITEDNPDVVHAHWTYESAIGALASGKPTLITVRDWPLAVLRQKPDAYRLGKVLMHFTTLFRGFNFTANSPYLQKYLQKYIRKDIPVIPNALDDVDFYKGERHPNISQPTIVSANNGFAKLKNVKSLLYAFNLIKKKIPTCRLILVGDEFERNGKAEQWAKEKGLAEHVAFAGYLEHDETLKTIENADLLIHPSLEESFGMTLLEAMAKKTPVIGGKDSGAVPWVLNYGEAGVLTDVKSPTLIADEAILLLTNEERWKMFSAAGYQHARNNFSLSKVVEQYLEAYDRLLRIMEV